MRVKGEGEGRAAHGRAERAEGWAEGQIKSRQVKASQGGRERAEGAQSNAEAAAVHRVVGLSSRRGGRALRPRRETLEDTLTCSILVHVRVSSGRISRPGDELFGMSVRSPMS